MRCESGAYLADFEGFYGDGVRFAPGGEQGDQGAGAGADDGDIAGAAVDGKEEVTFRRESEGSRAIANVNGGSALAIVDGVDGHFLGAEVGDVDQRVVCGDEAADGIGAHEVGADDIVGTGDDLRDGVGEGVGDEELAAVGLEGEMDGGLADLKHGFKSVFAGG